MSGQISVLHYLNQFFGGLGGEEHADAPLAVRDGAVGPGVELQRRLGDRGRVLATLIAGDNYMQDHAVEAAAEIARVVRAYRPSVVVAGPAFGAGRYGLACALVCRTAQEQLNVPAIAAMAPDNPAVAAHRQAIYILASGPNATDTPRALAALARFALKLGNGEPIGAAAEEGYVPRGFRRNALVEQKAAERVVALLHAKLAGRAYESEIPLQTYDAVSPASPLADLRQATLGLVTECGLVPRGNPDRIRSTGATNWAAYPLGPALDPASLELVHGGYDSSFGREDPNRMLPADVLRDLEREGVIGGLYDTYFVTVGNGTPVARCSAFGAAMAQRLRAAGVQGVVLPAT
jgi:glycine reductase